MIAVLLKGDNGYHNYGNNYATCKYSGAMKVKETKLIKTMLFSFL